MNLWEFIGAVFLVTVAVRIGDRIAARIRRRFSRRIDREFDLLQKTNQGRCLFCGWTEVKAEKTRCFENELSSWKYSCLMCDKEWTMTAKIMKNQND